MPRCVTDAFAAEVVDCSRHFEIDETGMVAALQALHAEFVDFLTSKHN